ncbi:TPA: hypothetical protein KR288_002523 [Clostridioides difficile]|uniref:major tail protein n=2 Tax=Clostridioides difficile TaxID=1496 RepID=UPI00038CAE02|nr:major tail protein [Clostridioides difficile]EGT3831882.1 hypothetical protein [Clostridioides difficile]EGT4017613.1 hypothetical protein [Clostridioides difficile]EGT4186036.1 hypothetical protein [Clostridioides difficile]EGT4217563.1 hypothetical protein [Clostridioides difficile]EGT4673846.1 hypothetical protein [Clostridioides difficile]
MNYKNKTLYGFNNVYAARVEEDGSYMTPVRIPGGKSVEVSFETSEDIEYADNIVADSDVSISKGSGKLNLLGLTNDEKAMLFGGENMSGGYALASNQNMPNLALLFEQEKRDGGKILNVLYNVQFNPSGLNAKTTEDKKEKSLQELEFNCYPGFDDKGYFFYSLDTKDEKADTTVINKWYTEIQLPKVTVLPESNTPKKLSK